MSEQPAGRPAPAGAGARLLALYDHALPQVYGYLLARCGQRAVAEDLTAETFLAAVDAVRAGPGAPVSTAWLVGVARHKLSDHWRRQAREQRALHAVAAEPGSPAEPDDPWEARLNALRARDVLQRLGPHHRAVLTLRYMDDLPVPEVADLLGRTVHATEALLVRARAARRPSRGRSRTASRPTARTTRAPGSTSGSSPPGDIRAVAAAAGLGVGARRRRGVARAAR